MGLKIIPLVRILVLFIPLTVSGESDEIIQVEFAKIKVEKGRSDSVEGTIYSFESRLLIKIDRPIDQRMVVDSLSTLIYNPSEQACVQIRRKSRAFLPVFSSFFDFLNAAGRIVPEQHFTIKGTVKRGDSLYTHWAPDHKRTSFRGRIETVYYRDKPVSVSTFDGKSRVLSLMLFSRDTLIKGFHLPMEITTCEIQKRDTVREKVSFRNLSMGGALPDSIRCFRIPPEVPCEVIEW
ncbi:MAG: hypothetical protein JW699_06910 [Chitinispirillaceae bacterium]|nr:hypothetical protein [Chitinispirillaceae bacterium]